jgi:hypothetical protein
VSIAKVRTGEDADSAKAKGHMAFVFTDPVWTPRAPPVEVAKGLLEADPKVKTLRRGAGPV